MQTYIAYHLHTTDDIIVGLLSQFEFEAFEENNDHIVAYISQNELTSAVKGEISQILEQYKINFFSYEVENKNWNEIWEASFQPVVVEGFCRIRADFHPHHDDVAHDIIINPKMAFGTGHHATTYMMVAAMEHIDMQNKIVFDFGCGTGILAILASKLGAKDIVAIDIEHESYVNTIENASINDISNISAFCGEMKDLPHRIYNVILANINRNILLRYAADLYDRLVDGGTLLISGILEDDTRQVVDSFEMHGFTHLTSFTKGDWMCIKFRK